MKSILLGSLLCFAAVSSVSAQSETTNQSVVIRTATPENHLSFRPDLYFSNYSSEDWYPNSAKRKPEALPLLASLVVPGSGQAINQNWIKAGVFTSLEVAAIYTHLKNKDLGRDLERDYWNYVETGWSPTKYLGFLVDYQNFYFPNRTLNYNDYAIGGADLAAIIASGAFPGSATTEWSMINLEKLRQLEAITLYGGTSGLGFSHHLPDFGSQQYYELVSKYFQFGPGWKDFQVGVDQINWEIEGMSQAWHTGAARSKRFNDRLRTARNVLSLIVVNHAVSGIDALISAKLNNRRIETALSPADGGTLHLSIRF